MPGMPGIPGCDIPADMLAGVTSTASRALSSIFTLAESLSFFIHSSNSLAFFSRESRATICGFTCSRVRFISSCTIVALAM